MPIRINSVQVTPTTTTVGQPVVIVVSAEDIEWNNVKQDFTRWIDVYHSFGSWDKVKNYIYTTPTITSDCVYCANGYALFDNTGDQISVKGGYTLQHSSIEVDSFIREVLNG